MKRLSSSWRGVLILALGTPLFAASPEPGSPPASAPAAGAIDINDPPRGVFSDEWYALMLKGQKSGHMHNSMERLRRSSRDIIRTVTDMTLEVGRVESRISITMTQSTEETLDGKPLGFKQRMQLGKIPSTTTGTINGGKVSITTRQFGMSMGTNTYDLPEGAIMSWGTYREQIRRGLRPGLKYDLSVYEPTIAPDRLTPTTVEVFDLESLDLFGRKVVAYRTRQTAHIKAGLLGGEKGIKTTAWMTEAGDVLKLQMSVPPIDLPFEVIACPKAVALAANDPAELMVSTLLHIDRKLDGRRAQSITYRLVNKDKGFELPETGMQKVSKQRDGSMVLTLTRTSARKSKPHARQSMSEEALKPYLAASADLNYKDPVVADLARKAAGNEKDPHKLAERLCRFVHDYVKSKNLSVGFGTASEVARSREGDCTEHGVLLAALGRAVGIPTRIVTGVVYTDEFAGEENVFVGHLWSQFWMDNEWVDVDAAFNQTDVDPTHIALGVSAAGDAGMADLVTSGWMSLNKLTLKVVEVK